MADVIPRRPSDAAVTAAPSRAFGNLDEGLWRRPSGLAPGRAIVALASPPRLSLIAIAPTPREPRLVK